MAGHFLSEPELKYRVEVARFYDWNYSHAGRCLDLDRKSIKGAVERARPLGLADDAPEEGYTPPIKLYEDYPPFTLDAATSGKHKKAVLPDFGDDDIPVKDIISSMSERFEKRFEHKQNRTWFDIKITEDKPMLLAAIGDIHADSDGCNWSLLERDLSLLASTPGAYAIHLGDATNHWAGRLLSLWSKQETSRKTGYKLVRYIMFDAGVNYLLWLLGNHDQFGDGGASVLEEMARHKLALFDWQAKFNLVFPNGKKCPCHFAHSFKGTSIYNPGHGMLRAAKFSQACPRIYAQGHHHEFYMHQGVYEDLDLTYWGSKTRGYKFIDEYADRHQFGSNTHGATVAIIINPLLEERQSGFIQVFPDLLEGVNYLNYLRGEDG